MLRLVVEGVVERQSDRECGWIYRSSLDSRPANVASRTWHRTCGRQEILIDRQRRGQGRMGAGKTAMETSLEVYF